VLVALAFGLGMGLFQGLCTTALRIPSFIVTLAGFSYLRGVAYGITGSVTLFGTTSSFRWFSEGEFSVPVTVLVIVGVFIAAVCFWGWQRWLLHRDSGIAGVVQSLRPVELVSAAVLGAVCGVALWVFVSYQGLPAPVAILLAIALVAAFVGRHTAFGRHVYAIGGNPEGARRAGINVTGVIVALFMFSGALAALGGVMQAARLDAGHRAEVGTGGRRACVGRDHVGLLRRQGSERCAPRGGWGRRGYGSGAVAPGPSISR